MEDSNFKQQELFETEKYISDLVEEKTNKKTSTLNWYKYLINSKKTLDEILIDGKLF